MDRHRYVEKLIKERDNLEKEITGFKEEISNLKKRTKEYILDWRGEPSQGYYVNNLSFGSVCCGEVKIPENERVSDDSIKDLHKQIFELENTKCELKGEISNLRRQDFLSFLKNLINEG